MMVKAASSVWSSSPDGAAEYFNQPWLTYTGLTLDQARGWGFMEAYHPEDRTSIGALTTANHPLENPLNDLKIERRLRGVDGSYRWFLSRAMALRDDAGNVIRWYGTSFDIEDRKRAEDALRRSEAYLAEAQQLSTTGSFGWQVATGALVWSEETYRIFGLDPTVKPTMDLILIYVHPDDRERVRHEINRVAEGKHDFDVEHRLLLPNGRVKYLHVRSHRVEDTSGGEEIVGAVMDVTVARDSQEALHSARAELAHVTRLTTLGEMGASIAHEVNQPLAGIITNAEACLLWLDRKTPDLAKARHSVELIIKDGNRAGEVIRSIRALSNKAASQRLPLDVNDLLEEVIALVRHELFDHQILLRTELLPILPTFLADRVQLRQVIINLVMNAVEAMQPVTDRPRDLIIRSAVKTDPHQVQVTVEDRGVGISAGHADQLFDAFFTTKASGMGMGLSICRSIIAAHGGRLWTEPNLTEGARFHFTLPLPPENSA
jgi:PAS domain S-box-containing protein